MHRTPTRARSSWFAVAALATSLAACGGETGTPDPRIDVVEAQRLSPPDTLRIEAAITPVASFLVIREDIDGVPGALIGKVALPPGESRDLVLRLDRAGRDGETLYAILHRDSGAPGVFEFDDDPTVDPPVIDGVGDVVKATFTVRVDEGELTPEIRAEAQTANPADEVRVTLARAAGPGFVVVYDDAAGELGRPLGHVAVDTGETRDLTIELDREATDGETLHAVLHVDDGEIGTFEFDGLDGKDDPVLDPDGVLVSAPFVVQVPAVLGPSVTVDDQDVLPLTRVTVRAVRSAGPGFVVIHADDGGAFGPVLGHTPVATGTTTDVRVELDREVRDGETLYAMLHVDDGVIGTYEFDGISGLDAPATDLDGDVVAPPFVVGFEPSVTAQDQDVDPVDRVLVPQTIIDGPGWLVIRDDAGGPGAVLGQASLTHGTSERIEVTLSRAARDGETLFATLHTDDGVAGTFEYDGSNGLDAPILDRGGNPVVAPFAVGFEASVRVEDQFLEATAVITVARVTSAGPGFIVVHADDAGRPGAVLGQAPVENGTSSDVSVELARGARQAEVLYAMLHRDTGQIGVYEFTGPGSPDGPAEDRAGAVIAPRFSVRFSELTANDQDVDPTTAVQVVALSSGGPGFVVVRADAGGAPGAVLGFTAVPAGPSTGVQVDLSRSVTFAETLHASLHVDDGAVGTFEFEGGGGLDAPATRDGADVTAPIVVRFQPKVVAADQTASPNNVVVIDDVISGGPGWIVVRDVATGGARGDIIGRAPLANGTNASVSVTLDRPVVNGETLYAVLHVDRGQAGVFEFDDPFAPPDAEVSINGNAVQTTFVARR